MYESFYGLREKPFNLTPNPRFLFLSDKHKEALAHLLFGIKNRSGFVMISGEIGTGKTTICRSLLRQVDPDTEVAFIFNPCLSPEELLRNINEDFGIESKAQTIKDLIDELNAYLLESSAENKNCVLVIDEAQNLTPNVLEQVRLLSNLETETNKLLQIILLGQPELAENLELPELRQLNQRITARYHLKELNYQETLQYVGFRLRIASARRSLQFTKAAVRAVYKHSGGTPRVINALCDRALLVGYTQEEQTITPRIVRQAIKEVVGERPKARRRHANEPALWLRPKPALLAAAVVAIAVLALVNPSRGAWVDALKGLAGQIWSDSTADEASAGREADGLGADARVATGPSGNPDAGADAPTSGRGEVMAAARPPQLFQPAPPMEADPPRAIDVELPSRNMALTALLGAWKLGRLSAMPPTNSPEDLAEFAKASGLAYENIRLDMNELAAVNLPALVRVRSKMGSVWVALLGIRKQAVILGDLSAKGKSYTRKEFENAYLGEAMIMWLDPTPSQPPLGMGKRGLAVAALQSSLQAFGFDSLEVTGVYSDSTRDAVRRVQWAAGLVVDGIAGRQTRMAMTSWSENWPTPSLGPKPFPEEVRAAIFDAEASDGVEVEVARIEAAPVMRPLAPGRANEAKGAKWTRDSQPVPGPIDEGGFGFSLLDETSDGGDTLP